MLSRPDASKQIPATEPLAQTSYEEKIGPAVTRPHLETSDAQ